MKAFDKLLDIMDTLRSPKGCAWDREQTHETLLPFLVEESHETIDAIESGNKEWEKEELGDLLLQVIFHCQIAKESGEYTIEEVLEELCEKLIRRHPHVFMDKEITTSEELEKVWEEIKAEEKKAKAKRYEVRTISPMFSRNVAHVLLKKKRFFEEKLESEVDYVSEDKLDISNNQTIESEVGNLLLKGIAKAFKNGIEPERAVWNAMKAYKNNEQFSKEGEH